MDEFDEAGHRLHAGEEGVDGALDPQDASDRLETLADARRLPDRVGLLRPVGGEQDRHPPHDGTVRLEGQELVAERLQTCRRAASFAPKADVPAQSRMRPPEVA